MENPCECGIEPPGSIGHGVSEHTVKMVPCHSVFTYIYSLLIEKDLRESKNVSVKFPCVYFGPLIQGSLSFFGKSFRFLFLFSCQVEKEVNEAPFSYNVYK